MAGLYTTAHELAVYELAPDAIIRKDLELLDELFQRIAGHPVDGWQDRGKVRSVDRRCRRCANSLGQTALPQLRGRHEPLT